MKKTTIFLFLLILLFLTGNTNAQQKEQKPLKIACVGNSITYGYGIVNRKKNAYPAQLQNILGNHYLVKNFGMSGRTLLKKGDYPYRETDIYRNALQFKPDVVYIMLGTNDSKLQNRIYLSEFKSDYTELIQSFKNQNSKVRVVILLPLPTFVKDTSFIWNPVIKKKIIPKLENIAYNNNVEIIDLYQLFINKSNLLPDHIHPSSLGATLISNRIYEDIKGNFIGNFNILKGLKLDSIKESNFHGFQQYNFEYKSTSSRIVKPKRVAIGKPWVIRARFWGHEPQTDIALLERGFHIAYCDVSNLFGNKEAVKRWNKFYKLMTKNGLSKKVVLEGMSRGGLITYNWAVKNPKKIACIYADAPVLDGKSWPGGFGKGKGSPNDWEEFKKIYHLNTDKKITSFKGNPIHKTKKIAKGKYPMMHVCGITDKVVPIDENTKIFERDLKKLGADIKVIYKENNGHHPHSLKNPTPIVDFILRSTGYMTNFAAIPAPGSEYRSAAGWKKGKGWWAQMNDIDSLCMHSGKTNLLLIGNSITQGWGGTRTLTTYKPGQKAADKYFKDLTWINAGISGDRTQHVAWRIKNGHYENCDPDFVVLAIGVNNFRDNTAKEIAKGIEMDLALVKQKLPNANVLLFGPLPTGIKSDSEQRRKYMEIHDLIRKLGEQNKVFYLNILNLVVDKNNDLKKEYFSSDGIHFIPKGYEIWANYISKFINSN